MKQFADFAKQAHTALTEGNRKTFGELIDANFDLRNSICNIAPDQLAMVHQARTAGASAKFAGSGGAIIGTYDDDAMFDRLAEQLAAIECRVLKPIIVDSNT